MAIPKNRKEFANFCLRKLGKGAIQINVTPDQIDDRIDEALNKFYENHHQAVEDVVMYFKVTHNDVRRGYFILPPEIVGVAAVERPILSENIWTIDYQFMLTEIYTLSSSYRFGDVTYWIMNKEHMSLLNRYFAPERSYTYNNVTNKLIILGGLKNMANTERGCIVRGYRKILGEANNATPLANPPTNTPTELTNEGGDINPDRAAPGWTEPATGNDIYYDIWRVKWLQDYATALIKKQWANNLQKYNGVQIIGGVTLTGEIMLAQANQEIADLETQLQDEFSLPPDFFIG